MGLDIIFR